MGSDSKINLGLSLPREKRKETPTWKGAVTFASRDDLQRALDKGVTIGYQHHRVEAVRREATPTATTANAMDTTPPTVPTRRRVWDVLATTPSPSAPTHVTNQQNKTSVTGDKNEDLDINMSQPIAPKEVALVSTYKAISDKDSEDMVEDRTVINMSNRALSQDEISILS